MRKELMGLDGFGKGRGCMDIGFRRGSRLGNPLIPIEYILLGLGKGLGGLHHQPRSHMLAGNRG